MSSDKIKVLFMGGSGRSGSTLLEIMLGQIDGFFPAGELMFIWERGLNEDQLCGCGKKFSDCEFWGYVLKEAFGNIVKLDGYKIENLGKSIRRRFIFPIEIKPRTYVRGILPCMLRMSDSVGTLFIYGLTSADLRRYD